MQDRFLFRGKQKNEYIDSTKNKWVYGVPVTVCENTYETDRVKIVTDMNIDELDGYMDAFYSTEVDPATIGQCTGLKDKNKKLFFDGDKCLSGEKSESDILYIVRWNKTYCYFYFEIVDRETGEHIDAQPFSDLTAIDYFEIIGNIHDTAPTEI